MTNGYGNIIYTIIIRAIILFLKVAIGRNMIINVSGCLEEQIIYTF